MLKVVIQKYMNFALNKQLFQHHLKIHEYNQKYVQSEQFKMLIPDCLYMIPPITV